MAVKWIDAEVVYPSSDGKPMADNTKQFNWITLIKENIEALYADQPTVFVAGDLFWYPVEGNPKIVMAPDVMVVLGALKGDRKSYRQWREHDIAPQVVFEVLSDANTPAEMLAKKNFYSLYGVKEYYVIDPDTQELKAHVRAEDTLRQVEPLAFPYFSRILGIQFAQEEDGLVLYHPNGEKFENFSQVRRQAKQANERAEQEHERAEQEHERAEQERLRADAEKARAEALAAKLRQMGINPDEA